MIWSPYNLNLIYLNACLFFLLTHMRQQIIEKKKVNLRRTGETAESVEGFLGAFVT